MRRDGRAIKALAVALSLALVTGLVPTRVLAEAVDAEVDETVAAEELQMSDELESSEDADATLKESESIVGAEEMSDVAASAGSEDDEPSQPIADEQMGEVEETGAEGLDEPELDTAPVSDVVASDVQANETEPEESGEPSDPTAKDEPKDAEQDSQSAQSEDATETASEGDELYAAATPTSESEPNNTIVKANSAKVNAEVRASMATTDEDWFVFTISTAGTYTLSFANDGGNGNTDFVYELLDNSRAEQVDSWKYFDNFEANEHSVYLPAGQAWLHVKLGYQGGSNSASYRFKLRNASGSDSLSGNAITSSNKAITATESEANNQLAKANTVKVNTEIRASMATTDVDWFVFNVPTAGTYTLSFANDGGTGNTNFDYYLYDDSRIQRVSSWKNFDNYEANEHEVYLKEGVAWLYVKLGYQGGSNSASYRFKLRNASGSTSMASNAISSANQTIGTSESEANNGIGKANVTKAGTWIQASMATTDVDWFVFNVPTAGTYTLSFANDGGTGNTNFDYYLYDDGRIQRVSSWKYFDNYEANEHEVYLKEGVAWLYVKLGYQGGSNSASYRFKLAYKSNFLDVEKTAWYYEVVNRAAFLGLISGYSSTKFGPNDPITRGQVAVILWRMAGRPSAGSGAKSFSDVKSGAYYYDAVRWASSKGVVSGYANGKFGPNDNVTREQLAVMLANYASKIGKKSVTGSARDYSKMSDASKVSSYARTAVGWCFRNKILSGTNGKVNPQGKATRAQAAKMLVGLYDMVN